MVQVEGPVRRTAPRVAVAAAILAGVGAAAILLRGRLRPPVEFLPRPVVFVTDIVKSEDGYDLANPSIKGTFVKGLKGRDWAAVAASLTDDFRARFPGPGDGREVPDGAIGLREYRDAAFAETDRAGFVKVLQEHVESWSAVERTTWRPFEFLFDPSGKSAFASIHFQVAGVRPDGTRADLNGIIRAGMVSDDGKAWKLRRVEWVEGCREDGKRAPWADVTEACGLTFNESEEIRKLRQEMINDRGVVNLGGLTVCDWNGDGFWDVLATRVNDKADLFLNDGKGGFVRGESPAKSGAEVGFSFLRVDLDNDGVDELVDSQVLEYEGNKAYLGIYTQKDGQWVLHPRALSAKLAPGIRGVAPHGIVPADIDGDGFLDLFFCNYSQAESNGKSFNRVAAYDGMDNWLFMNHGALNFTEESDERGITGTQFTYVSKFWDFDGDGDLDLFETNDFGPNHLWVNDGHARFKDAKDHLFDADSNYTMGMTIADWDNTGEWTVYISNMYSHAGNRIVPLSKEISPEMKRLGMVLAQGNQMYERHGGVWTEDAVGRGTNWADWAWGCVFFDADNDTDKDLFVANGYTTNSDPKAPDF
ncbi:MAG: VCBS repeat-containing protein [Planctomycetes bacterium]|nr:VCBS repeat-containing protein [Planctomycetota bacterium]